jgi:hypothetical protein
VFFSLGSKPLELWNKVVINSDDTSPVNSGTAPVNSGTAPVNPAGEIKKVIDSDIQSAVYELTAPNTLISKVYLSCPADPSKSLGIKLRMMFYSFFDRCQKDLQ